MADDDMNHRERFLAVANGETVDHIPLFGFPGAPGMSRGCMKRTHERLVATGMPPNVGGMYEGGVCQDVESWYRYWGTTGPAVLDFSLERGVQGFKSSTRLEGGFEIIEEESGAITRQVLNNDITYSMPQFIRYAVRDRHSWAYYKDRVTPTERMPPDEMEAHCRRFDDRDMPLVIGVGGIYGFLRGLMGLEALSVAFYEDQELIHDMVQWRLAQVRRYRVPLIERLKPEVVQMGEDLCFNRGMLLSPSLFHAFCGPYYREVCGCARAAGAAVVAVDTDGNAMEFTRVAKGYGVNAIFPFEVKAGNDLFALRRDHPDFILFGWLEKEVVNEANEDKIEPEILSKVPPLLAQGRYFPNGDHGIQPLVTFPNLCKFMTVLHEVCGNPEGTFPRR